MTPDLKAMTPERLAEIKETYRMVKAENTSVYHPFLGDCLAEIERLRKELAKYEREVR